MASLWRDINSYTQGQKRALIAIWILILVVIIFSFFSNKYFLPSGNNPEIDTLLTQLVRQSIAKEVKEQEVFIKNYFDPNFDSFEFLLETGIPRNIARNIVNFRNAGKEYETPDDLRKVYGMSDSIFAKIKPYIAIERTENQKRYYKNKYDRYSDFDANSKPLAVKKSFDPNKASLEELMSVGLPQKVAKNIVSYRTSVKLFTQHEDLLNVYNIDSAMYLQIKDSVSIDNQQTVEVPVTNLEINIAVAREMAKTTKIEIEKVYKVLNYRNRLGGFFETKQLYEVEGIDTATINAIINSTWIDTIQIKKINLNLAEYKDLIRHPYLSQSQVSTLLRYRNFAKHIKTFEELIRNKVLTKQDVVLLRPYIVFE